MGKHYTNLSIQDVFRKIKADNPGYRLKACGLKVAMVARHRVPGKRVYYEISGKSDE